MPIIETIYKIWCPNQTCSKVCYINNGDTNDLTSQDVEGVICPWCNNHFLLSDENLETYGEEYEPYYQTGMKTMCNNACCNKPPAKKKKGKRA